MLADLIKGYLDDNGIKYSFVANKTGIPLNTLSAMLNYKRKISAEEYFTICIVLNVDANYFANKVQHAS